jgi:hypothetical protein
MQVFSVFLKKYFSHRRLWQTFTLVAQYHVCCCKKKEILSHLFINMSFLYC